ncbi:hypothetical protein IW261DRAFT_1423548 [Armillaria novae-zelandiae]|uniref:Uncharacterized protein n=1 Tax=Armillaria novae-zelandiae TaxID=153914 RepID=A0AA39TYM7_9AGAR|nr:hypothetical protein IW261DRAFT_1423548 [Armillaria novae-zelandiae]
MLFLACRAPFLSLVSNLSHLVTALLSFALMASRISAKGVKSVMKLTLSAAINIFVPQPAFYVCWSIGRQLFFEGDKTKQKLLGSMGWHSSRNLSKIKHYTIRGFDIAGNMVFMAELADRMVDSEAWVYSANQSKETFNANDYARIAH